MKRKWRLLIFCVYSLAMLWLLFGQRIGQDNGAVMQLQPLTTLRLQLRVLFSGSDPGLRYWALRNLAGNVVLFVPLGFLVPWIWGVWRKWWRHALLMTGIIVSVELLQITFSLGTCDIDDLLLNLIGTGMGFFAWKLTATSFLKK